MQDLPSVHLPTRSYKPQLWEPQNIDQLVELEVSKPQNVQHVYVFRKNKLGRTIWRPTCLYLNMHQHQLGCVICVMLCLCSTCERLDVFLILVLVERLKHNFRSFITPNQWSFHDSDKNFSPSGYFLKVKIGEFVFSTSFSSSGWIFG